MTEGTVKIASATINSFVYLFCLQFIYLFLVWDDVGFFCLCVCVCVYVCVCMCVCFIMNDSCSCSCTLVVIMMMDLGGVCDALFCDDSCINNDDDDNDDDDDDDEYSKEKSGFIL